MVETEMADAIPVQTGTSVITIGGALPCDWIIHSVGPKYSDRYVMASDQALHSAYKSALLLAAEKKLKKLVINCIYLTSKKYPRFDAAHVALRTVRKFLEHASGIGNCFQQVMFCVQNEDDFEIYSTLMTAYFPRSVEEMARQSNLLPKKEELGDDWGQVSRKFFAH